MQAKPRASGVVFQGLRGEDEIITSKQELEESSHLGKAIVS
jgi:hypothetical protein